MPSFFLAALLQLFERRFQRLLWLGLVLSVGLLAGLSFGGSLLFATLVPDGVPGIGIVLAGLGALAGLILGWLFFPALTASLFSLMVEPIARAVEARHYPGVPPPRSQSAAEMVASALRLAATALLVNLAALPVYLLLPAFNLFIFLFFNGYLVGKGYFEMAAARRFEPPVQRLLWRAERGSLWLAGACLAALLTIPLVNLVTPMLAIAFMVHTVERMRHRQKAK